MLKKLGLVLTICCLLNACSFFNTDNNTNEDRLARCKEIKRRLIFNGATNNEPNNNQILEAEQNAGMDRLERDYRRLDCN